MASLCINEFGAHTDVLPEADFPQEKPAGVSNILEGDAFFLRMIELLPSYIHIKDEAGRWVFNNRAHTVFLGATERKDLLGKTDFDFFPAALAQQYRDQEQTVIRTGQTLAERLEPAQNRAGQSRWLSTTRIPITDPAGKTSLVLCVSQDVTERQAAEESLRYIDAVYRTLIEGLPQRVFFKNSQSAFVSVNAIFARDLGMRPQDLIGKNDFDLFSKELAAKYQADDQRIMNLRQPEILEEVNVSDGTERIVEVVKAPVISPEGQLLGLLGLFSDITERKRAEEKLKSFALKLQRSNRELQDFAYVASHDLQEPLRKVMVFGKRLQAKYRAAMGSEGSDYLDRMIKATLRMQTLINDLLTYARVTTKAQPFEALDLDQVAREVISDLEMRIEHEGAQVEVSGLPSLEADPMQMRQLLQNLIGNALKYRRPDTAPRVKLKGRILDAPAEGAAPGESQPGECEITVEDNGIGFEDKYAERIFQVFQRLHNRSEYEGSGIGLAICRKIVERHNGAVTAAGIPGQGATFTVRLPLTQNKKDAVYDS